MSLWVIATCLGLLPGNQTTAMLITVPATASTASMTTEQPTTTGSLRIISRLGTTLAPYTAKNITYFVGDSAQVSSYNNAVKVLRPHRIPYRRNMTKTDTFPNIRKINDTQNTMKAPSGACVPTGTCIRNRIDVRIVTPQAPCPTGQEYCGGTSTRGDLFNISCGVIQPVPPSSVILESGQAGFGEIPWQGALLAATDYVTGVVLIDGLNVLTVAHKLSPYLVSDSPNNLKVRLGDWVLKDTVSYQENTVLKVCSHPKYNPSTLENDVAILRLASAVPFTPSAGAAVSINRACLPQSSSAAYIKRRCIVSERHYQMLGPKAFIKEIRKKIDVSIVDSQTCQSLQRQTSSSELNIQTSSFICARGEDDEDACSEDGGSGLLCEVDGKWQIVGLYTKGLGCGVAKTPGVYVNVATFLTWIQEKIASL